MLYFEGLYSTVRCFTVREDRRQHGSPAPEGPLVGSLLQRVRHHAAGKLRNTWRQVYLFTYSLTSLMNDMTILLVILQRLECKIAGKPKVRRENCSENDFQNECAQCYIKMIFPGHGEAVHWVTRVTSSISLPFALISLLYTHVICSWEEDLIRGQNIFPW